MADTKTTLVIYAVLLLESAQKHVRILAVGLRNRAGAPLLTDGIRLGMMSRPVHRVALLINLSTSYGKRILEGVNAHPLRAEWELLAESWGDIGTENLLSGEHADGIIVDSTDIRFHEMLRISRKPTVLVAGPLSDPTWARVTPDFAQAGRLAAEHFLEKGFRKLAFIGTSQVASRELRRSFVQAGSLQGIQVSVQATRLCWRGRRQQERDRLSDWLKTLPHPLEQRFREVVGHGPAEELRRIRLRKAQLLLRETDWGLGVVASSCGLQSPERLCAVFRERVGMTPGQFRGMVGQPSLARDGLVTLGSQTAPALHSQRTVESNVGSLSHPKSGHAC